LNLGLNKELQNVEKNFKQEMQAAAKNMAIKAENEVRWERIMQGIMKMQRKKFNESIFIEKF